MPSCTAGRWRRTAPSSTPTRTTCAAWTSRCGPSTRPRCASASPATTSSTSPTPGCSPASRGLLDADVEFEMLLGMAQGQVEAVARDVGHVLLYVPVVRPDEFDVAISYLVRRLEENASSDNFLSAAFELADDPAMFDRERDRFLASIDRADGCCAARPAPTAVRTAPQAPADPCRARAPGSCGMRPGEDAGLTQAVARHRPIRGIRRRHRTARAVGRGDACSAARPSSRPPSSRRGNPATAPPARPASATPPTPTPRCRRTASGRASILGRIETSTAGDATIDAARDHRRASARGDRRSRAGRGGGVGRDARRRTRGRAAEAAARSLEARRGELIEVAASETGKVFAEADVEVSEAVDFANYYAATARELDRVSGAVFEPSRLTVVTPPWNFPIAIPAGGVLAALAAGSGVVFKPAPQARRCAAVRRRGAVGRRCAPRRAGPRRHRRGVARPAARLASATSTA